jgi:hypothetical protein
MSSTIVTQSLIRTGIYAAEMVRGATEEEQGVPRVLMYMKHFDACKAAAASELPLTQMILLCNERD